ncbi:MAG: FGGY-family carbohydrate kinase [Runella sp.]
MKQPVCAVLDIGKTNKKAFIFDPHYRIVWEQSVQFDETTDEDGYPCENIALLTAWVLQTVATLLSLPDFEVKALHFTTYGASLVHLDQNGKVIAPLYNYLKPFPESLQKQFYETYRGEANMARQTASPVLGSLNSGLILYRLKYEKPALFEAIRYSLHLPQYVSYLITKKFYSDITSIGCHTHLWDFDAQCYHHWVKEEGIDTKLAPLHPADQPLILENGVACGVGLHDSSAALIPYLVHFKTQRFVLISTGTWCISLNPFNHTPLTDDELRQDCLCYLQYNGLPVKASRLFAGFEHEQATKRLATQYEKPIDAYKNVGFDSQIIETLKNGHTPTTYEEAYHALMLDIVKAQIASTQLVLNNAEVEYLFVDGGFSKNPIYMNLLAMAFPNKKVCAASVAQATALGAALCLHAHWNPLKIPADLIECQIFGKNQ